MKKSRAKGTTKTEKAIPTKKSLVGGASVPPPLDEDRYFRALMRGSTGHSLTTVQLERAISSSYWLFEHDALAAQIIFMPRKALASGGISFDAEDDVVAALIKEWWESGPQPFRELLFGDHACGIYESAMIAGSLTLPTAIFSNGAPEYGFIEPQNIKEVTKVSGNALRLESVVLKEDPAHPDAKRTFQIINVDFAGNYTGEVFHWNLFSRINATRGMPFLFRYLDQLDIFGQFVYNEAERAAMMRSFVWLVTLSGQTPEQCRTWLNENFPGGTPPQAGTVRAKTEGEVWEAITPALQGADLGAMAGFLKEQAFGPTGYPVFWFGNGGGVNNTVSREMMIQAGYNFAEAQKFVTRMLTPIIGHMLQNAALKGRVSNVGRLTANVERTFSIRYGSPLPRDEVQAAGAMSNVVSACSVAVGDKLMPRRIARELILVCANMLNVTHTMDEALRYFEEEEEEELSGEDENTAANLKRVREAMEAQNNSNPPEERPNNNEEETEGDGDE